MTFTGGINYSPDFFNGSGDGWYPNGGVKVGIPIPDQLFTLTLEGYTGHQWVEDNGRFGADDYQDWKLGLSVGIKMLTLSAYYTDTNLGKSDCGGTGNCGPRAVWRSAPPSDKPSERRRRLAASALLPPACACCLRLLPSTPATPGCTECAAGSPQPATANKLPCPWTARPSCHRLPGAPARCR